MTDKIVAWISELTGYYDEEGEWIEPDKEEDFSKRGSVELVKLAVSRKLDENIEEKEMTSKLSKTSANISYRSMNGIDFILTEPVNGKWVYKQRVHDKRMVPIGVLNDKNQLIVMYPPHDSEKGFDNGMGQVVSRYLTSFWIDKEPKETINFSEVYTRKDTEESLSHYVQIIDNLDEIQQITTSFEGKYYALGWICGYKYEDPATVIFYDQYTK